MLEEINYNKATIHLIWIVILNWEHYEVILL